jgi:hypothetical protein
MALREVPSASGHHIPGNGTWDTTTANRSADGGSTTTTFTSDGTVDVSFNTSGNAVISISSGMNPASTTANPSGGTLQFNGSPLAEAGGWALQQLWLFWVAPLIGAALAGVTYRFVSAETTTDA